MNSTTNNKVKHCSVVWGDKDLTRRDLPDPNLVHLKKCVEDPKYANVKDFLLEEIAKLESKEENK